MQQIIKADNELQSAPLICPFGNTLHILSGKWKNVIICQLMKGPKRFSHLKREMPRCTRRMLSMQLNQLEKDLIIKKQIFADSVPIKTVYSLTPIGNTLIPIILEMNKWGSEYQKLINSLDD